VRISAFCLVAFTVFPTAHAEESATAKSKPTVYIHITSENDPLDKAIENAYAKKITIVEVRNSKEFTGSIVRESVHPRPVLGESGQELRGEVLVVIIVTSDGRAIEPVTLKSADKRLNVAALDAVRQWRFMPARLNGSPVSETFYVLFAKAAKSEALAIFAPPPRYPKIGGPLGQRPEGSGVVMVEVDETTGQVTSAKMEKSTGYKILDDAALEAFSRWRFRRHSSQGNHSHQLHAPNAFLLIKVHPIEPLAAR